MRNEIYPQGTVFSVNNIEQEYTANDDDTSPKKNNIREKKEEKITTFRKVTIDLLLLSRMCRTILWLICFSGIH